MTHRRAEVEPEHRPAAVTACAARSAAHRKFACQAKRRRLCKLIAFGSFPRHRPVAVVARRFGAGNEWKELTRGRDERPFRRLPCAKRGAFAAEKRGCASPTGGRRTRPQASRRRFERRPSNGDEVESAEFQGRDARIASIDPQRNPSEFAGGPRRSASLLRSSRRRGRPVAIFPVFRINPTHRRRSRGRDVPNEGVADRVVAPRENLPCQTR